jgi:hypothetical protein
MSRKKKIKIDKLLSAKPKKEFEWFESYTNCLNLFWNADTRKAVDKIGQFLEKNHDSDGKFHFYRLWIECLDMDQDYSGLVALNEHFDLRSRDLEFAEEYLALKGLVHLKLDEFEAADLVAEGFDSDCESSFMYEFANEYNYRNQNADVVHIPFTSFKGQVWDYFHLRNLNTAILVGKCEKEFKECSAYLKKIYGSSPAFFASKIGEQVKKGSFGRAYKLSDDLVNSYPKNLHFKGLKASISALAGDKKESLKLVFSVLKKTFFSDEAQLANWCMLDNAEEGYKNTSATVKNFEQSFELESSQLSEDKRVWMTFVGNEIYSDIADNRDGEDLGFKMQLSSESQKGDWVLFAKKATYTGGTRVLGIFEVVEKLQVKLGVSPNAYLEPVHVFEKSIELDIHEVDQNDDSELLKSFGLTPMFEIDNAGLEVVFDEIEDQLVFDTNIATEIQRKWNKTS